MEISDVLAIYASAVSTILAFIKIRSKSKNLKIVFDYVSYYETVYLNLINQSERPITVVSISMQLDLDPVPNNCMFEHDEIVSTFPKVVQGYGVAQMQLTGVVSDYIITENAKNLSLKVFDAEGKVYSKYKIREVNGKWGDIDKGVFRRYI